MFANFFGWLNQQPQGTASFLGTLAGSTLGFLALLAGALFNAHLNRRRDDRLREHERRALATALYAELQLIREMFLSNCESLRKPVAGENAGFVLPPPVVKFMPELTGRIGFLSPETIKTVMGAYLVIEQTRRELLTLGAKPARDSQNDQLFLPNNHAPMVLMMLTSKADYIGKALAALEPYLKK
jgi:hypothetical protein